MHPHETSSTPHRPPLVSRFSDVTPSSSASDCDRHDETSRGSSRQSSFNQNAHYTDRDRRARLSDVENSRDSGSSIREVMRRPASLQRSCPALHWQQVSRHHRPSPLFVPPPPVVEASTQTGGVPPESLCGAPILHSSSASNSAFDPLRWTTSDYRRRARLDPSSESSAPEPVSLKVDSSFLFQPQPQPSVDSSTSRIGQPDRVPASQKQSGVIAWTTNVAHAAALHKILREDGGNVQDLGDDVIDDQWWNKASSFAGRWPPEVPHRRGMVRRQSC